jgi:hypothetical protein
MDSKRTIPEIAHFPDFAEMFMKLPKLKRFCMILNDWAGYSTKLYERAMKYKHRHGNTLKWCYVEPVNGSIKGLVFSMQDLHHEHSVWFHITPMK